MAITPYTRPRGAIHSIAAISALSDERSNLLCISDRSLYLLQNLVAQDVTFRSRYAATLLENGYIPVSFGTPEDAVYQAAVDALAIEIEDMSCDIVAALQDIRDAIQALSVNAGSSSTTCCNYTFDPSSYYEDAPGSGSPSEKCLLSYAFALAWERGANEFYHQWAQGGFPSVGILSAILDEFDLPGQALLEMVTLGAANVLPLLEAVWQGIVSDLVLPITCAIYDAPDSASAKTAIYTEIDAVTTPGLVENDLLKGPIQNNGLNKVFDGTFPTAGVTPPDCEAICFESPLECITFPFDISAGECLADGGTCQWDGTQGDPLPGSLELIITIGVNEQRFELDEWNDIVVSEGDEWTVQIKSAAPDNFNIAITIALQGPTTQDAFLVRSTTDWEPLTVTIAPEHDGLAVTGVFLFINKALNAETRTAWFDTLCYIPAP